MIFEQVMGLGGSKGVSLLLNRLEAPEELASISVNCDYQLARQMLIAPQLIPADFAAD